MTPYATAVDAAYTPACCCCWPDASSDGYSYKQPQCEIYQLDRSRPLISVLARLGRLNNIWCHYSGASSVNEHFVPDLCMNSHLSNVIICLFVFCLFLFLFSEDFRSWLYSHVISKSGAKGRDGGCCLLDRETLRENDKPQSRWRGRWAGGGCGGTV